MKTLNSPGALAAACQLILRTSWPNCSQTDLDLLTALKLGQVIETIENGVVRLMSSSNPPTKASSLLFQEALEYLATHVL